MTTILDAPVIEDITVEERPPEKCFFYNCCNEAVFIILLHRPCGCDSNRILVCYAHKIVMTSPDIKCWCTHCQSTITIKDIWAIK